MKERSVEICQECGDLFVPGKGGPIPTRCRACRKAAHNERSKIANRARRHNAPRPSEIYCEDCGVQVGVRGSVGGVPRFCSECGAVRRRASLKVAYRKHSLKSLYGLTEEQHAELVVKQDAACAICCEKKPRLNVDHNHKTGQIRGLLCSNCNTALGLLGDDSLIAQRASAYLFNGGVADAV